MRPNLNAKVKWIARNPDGTVNLFQTKPQPHFNGGTFVAWVCTDGSFHWEFEDGCLEELLSLDKKWITSSKLKPQESLLKLENFFPEKKLAPPPCN